MAVADVAVAAAVGLLSALGLKAYEARLKRGERHEGHADAAAAERAKGEQGLIQSLFERMDRLEARAVDERQRCHAELAALRTQLAERDARVEALETELRQLTAALGAAEKRAAVLADEVRELRRQNTPARGHWRQTERGTPSVEPPPKPKPEK